MSHTLKIDLLLADGRSAIAAPVSVSSEPWEFYVDLFDGEVMRNLEFIDLGACIRSGTVLQALVSNGEAHVLVAMAVRHRVEAGTMGMAFHPRSVRIATEHWELLMAKKPAPEAKPQRERLKGGFEFL